MEIQSLRITHQGFNIENYELLVLQNNSTALNNFKHSFYSHLCILTSRLNKKKACSAHMVTAYVNRFIIASWIKGKALISGLTCGSWREIRACFGSDEIWTLVCLCRMVVIDAFNCSSTRFPQSLYWMVFWVQMSSTSFYCFVVIDHADLSLSSS